MLSTTIRYKTANNTDKTAPMYSPTTGFDFPIICIAGEEWCRVMIAWYIICNSHLEMCSVFAEVMKERAAVVNILPASTDL